MHINVAVFQTLADPTRLKILEILRGGEKTVNNIVDMVDIQQSGVSRHLNILHEAGFVQMRPDGQKRLYSIRLEPFREVAHWVHTYEKYWKQKLDNLEKYFSETKGRKRNESKNKNR
jgi:DNA-binding transcriptional ArsR family regulator